MVVVTSGSRLEVVGAETALEVVVVEEPGFPDVADEPPAIVVVVVVLGGTPPPWGGAHQHLPHADSDVIVNTVTTATRAREPNIHRTIVCTMPSVSRGRGRPVSPRWTNDPPSLVAAT